MNTGCWLPEAPDPLPVALPQLSADFGPGIPEQGVEGLLFVAEPEDACSDLTPPAHLAGKPWVALIRRTQGLVTKCTFDMKVWHGAGGGGWKGVGEGTSVGG